MADLSNLTASDWAAWYAATISTSVFVWDVYKFLRAGPRLRIRCAANMQLLSREHGLGEQKYISFTVTNTGSQKTTITHLTLHYYQNLWALLRRKATLSLMAVEFDFSKPLPQVLDAGESWQANLRQTDEMKIILENGYLYAGVRDDVTAKTTYIRMLPKK